MMRLGPGEIILILAVAIVVFGPSRLPEIGRAIGKSIAELKKASRDIRKNLEISENIENIEEGKKEL